MFFVGSDSRLFLDGERDGEQSKGWSKQRQ